MASLDALTKQRYPIGRRHTRNRTSYGSMHNWLHSELSGHTLSTYKDPEGRLVSKKAAPPSFDFVLAAQRGCQTVPEVEEEEEEEPTVSTVRLASPGGIMPDYPQYRELRECMTERDRNRHGVNYAVGGEDLRQPPPRRRGKRPEKEEEEKGGSGWTKLPILPSPRPHDQNPPVHLQYGPHSTGYDDAHKAYLKRSRATGDAKDQPKLRNGKGGSTWRHIKFPLQPDGNRMQFVDGQVSLGDAYKRQLQLSPTLLEHQRQQQQQQQQQQTGATTQRARRNLYDINRRPTAKRGMEYNNWLVMR